MTLARRTRRRTVVRRILLVILLTVLLRPAPAAAELPPHAQNHPRLLFGANGGDSLYAVIQTQPRRWEVWLELQDLAVILLERDPEVFFMDSFAYEEIEQFCLIAQCEPGPLSGESRELLETLILYQIETYDAETDDFLAILGPILRLHNLCWAYDNAFAQAPEATRQLVVDEILLYLETMLVVDAFTNYLHNPYISNKGISLGANLILAQLTLAPDLPGEPLLSDARAFGEALLAKCLGELLCEDGSYHEGSGYMSWALRTLLPAAHAAARLEGLKLIDDDRFARALEWTAWQSFPSGQGYFLNRNDHNTRDCMISRHHSFLEWGTSRGPDPGLARWLLRRVSGDLGHSWGTQSDVPATLLWHEDGPEIGPADVEGTRFWPGEGFWVRRRGWPGVPVAGSYLLTMEGGQFVGGHAQEDIGQLILRAHGYGFALDNGWGPNSKQTEGHNLPLVGGLGQHNAGNAIGTDGELHLELDGSFFDFVRVDMTAAYTTHSPFNDPGYPFPDSDWSWGYDGGNPMTDAWRELLVLTGGPGEMPEIYLRDLLYPHKSYEPLPIEWRQHMTRFLDFQDGGEGLWRASYTEGSLRIFLHQPPSGEVSYELTNFTNDSVDRDTKVFRVTHESEHAEFVWQWNPLSPGEEEPATSTERFENGLRLHSRRGGRERKLLLTAGLGEAPLVIGPDRLDGAWALVEREGAATRTLLLRGTLLREDGRLLAELDERGSAAYDGDSVFLSDPTLGFRVWAPGASAVSAWGEPVPFEREGNYVVGPPGGAPPADDFVLSQAWPNPGPAPLRFRVELGSPVKELYLEIFDPSGRRVRRLGPDTAGLDSIFVWDGCDATGRELPSGLYLARCRADDRTRSRKALLLRP